MTRTMLALLVLVGLGAMRASASPPIVDQVELSGDINTITSAYIGAAAERAGSDGASALLVVMNTPGGISTSMDEIVTALLNCKVPVIVFVYPSGARAASAGLFVAEAADIVAMAPGTNIGSAHPIQASGDNLQGDLGAKVLNDAVTRVRNLASAHHRNADWSEDAVRHSVNINAEDAVKMQVADLTAADVPGLLAALDGRTIDRPNGQSLTLRLGQATVRDAPMPFWQEILHALIDPTVAALLILVATYGLIAEVSTPGAILPGVIGGISAILAFVALANLPVSVAGALLLLLALALLIADLKANTHGILSAGGLVALIIGLAFLVNTGPIGLGVSPFAVVGAAIATAAFFWFFVRRVWAARRLPAYSGPDAMLGAHGEAREDLAPEGLVFVSGALWKAIARSGTVAKGETVRVVGRHGLQLDVVAGETGGKENG